MSVLAGKRPADSLHGPPRVSQNPYTKQRNAPDRSYQRLRSLNRGLSSAGEGNEDALFSGARIGKRMARILRDL